MKPVKSFRTKTPTQIMGEVNTTTTSESVDKLYQIGAFVMIEKGGKEFGVPLSNVLCVEFEKTKKGK